MTFESILDMVSTELSTAFRLNFACTNFYPWQRKVKFILRSKNIEKLLFADHEDDPEKWDDDGALFCRQLILNSIDEDLYTMYKDHPTTKSLMRVIFEHYYRALNAALYRRTKYRQMAKELAEINLVIEKPRFKMPSGSIPSLVWKELETTCRLKSDGTNLDMWKSKVDFVLLDKNIAYVLSKEPKSPIASGYSLQYDGHEDNDYDKKWVDDDSTSIHLILNSIDDDLYATYKDESTARSLMFALEDHCTQSLCEKLECRIREARDEGCVQTGEASGLYGYDSPVEDESEGDCYDCESDFNHLTSIKLRWSRQRRPGQEGCLIENLF